MTNLNSPTLLIGIAVVITHPSYSGKILVVQEGKPKKIVGREPGMFSIPGGGPEIGESIIECAQREVFEETGYKVKIKSFLGIYQIQRGIGLVLVGQTKGRPDSKKPKTSEILNVEWMNPKEFISGKIKLRPAMKEIITDYLKEINFPLEIIKDCR
jgi:8-oxo-dGTP pyrophosphatase MutT (NUDIX family)